VEKEKGGFVGSESMKPVEAPLAQIGFALLTITVPTFMYNCFDCILILSNPNVCVSMILL
jgi:hypothetical protein